MIIGIKEKLISIKVFNIELCSYSILKDALYNMRERFHYISHYLRLSSYEICCSHDNTALILIKLFFFVLIREKTLLIYYGNLII